MMRSKTLRSSSITTAAGLATQRRPPSSRGRAAGARGRR
jgi:hypothetical protein